MNSTTGAAARGCPDGGAHQQPVALKTAFPLIGSTPAMAKALAATWFECPACVTRHCETAALNPNLLSQALYLWLTVMSIARYERGLSAVASADAMLDIYPRTLEFSEETFALLKRITLTEAMSPEGRTANSWSPETVQEMVEGLTPDQRKTAWIDILLILTGWLQGTAKAEADARVGQYPRP